jgi:magnesium-transporting ATPase (P-type)
MVSLITFLTYSSRLCTIKEKLKRQITFEQRDVAVLALLLFFFNNPWYLVQIYSPTTASFTFSGFQSALFVAFLLVFWLKNLVKFQPREASMRAEPLAKLARKSLDGSFCSQMMLSGMFGALLFEFMLVYAWYYHKLKSDPGFAYTHTAIQDKRTKAVIASSVIVLLIFYSWYLLSLICNIRLIFRQDKSKIAFVISSVVMHIALICSFMLGVYS